MYITALKVSLFAIQAGVSLSANRLMLKLGTCRLICSVSTASDMYACMPGLLSMLLATGPQ